VDSNTAGGKTASRRTKLGITDSSRGGPVRPRTGLNALKAQVKVRGLAVLDRRTLAARHLLDWRAELLDDLGGEAATSAAQRALVEVATRTKLYLDHVDAVLMAQDSLIVKRTRRRHHLMPLVEQRQRIADSLVRTLTQLGLERRQRPSVDLNQYLAQRRPSAPAPDAPPTEGAHHGDDDNNNVREIDSDGHAGP
jgi:hypothetical protein